MKNFICFLFCSFLMLFASVGVQASGISEPIASKSDISVVDIGLSMIQNDVAKITTMDCLVIPLLQSVFVIAESPAIQSKSIAVPKCPFRYIYKSKYCTHYSNTAYSRLTIPY